jgi:tetratricopeptide (TPR) repeat protein
MSQAGRRPVWRFDIRKREKAMNLTEAIQRLVGRPGHNFKQDPEPAQTCPDENEILSYREGGLSPRHRTQLEKHFARCAECRELLALSAQFDEGQMLDGQMSEGRIDETDMAAATLPEDLVKKQAARILAFIEADELKHRDPVVTPRARAQKAGAKAGFYISYSYLAVAAMLILAIAVASIYFATRSSSPELAGMQKLAQAMKEGRRSEARISGELPYARYSATRGVAASDNIQYDEALSKLKSAEAKDAPASERLALARVYLARNEGDDVDRAHRILSHLVAGGADSPQLFNDLGVAEYHLKNYSAAINNFDKALAKSPGFSEALFNKALAEQRASLYERAKEDWKRFIASTSDERWKAEAERHLESVERSLAR